MAGHCGEAVKELRSHWHPRGEAVPTYHGTQPAQHGTSPSPTCRGTQPAQYSTSPWPNHHGMQPAQCGTGPSPPFGLPGLAGSLVVSGSKPQCPGWRGSCHQPKAVVVHDASLGHSSTPGLPLALGITLARRVHEGSSTMEVPEATPRSPGASRLCFVWCKHLE